MERYGDFMEREKHINTINAVKKFISIKDYEGLKVYIEKREKEIKESIDEDESSKYMDDLVKELK